jgi:deazaflavin-dependent oxidoreductase (nitroreductase family)
MTRTRIRTRFFWLLKNTLNRVTGQMARASHGPFSLIRHVGRKSGRTYETPVILVQVPEGFIAELTYGENVNWYRNIVAAGGCVVVHHRREYRVTHLEPCSAEYGRGCVCRSIQAHPESCRSQGVSPPPHPLVAGSRVTQGHRS